MRYPKYAKIYFEDGEEWCAKLNDDDEYISEDLEIKESKFKFIKSEMYPIEELKECGLKYEKITKKEYRESIIEKTKQQFENEIASLYQKIEELKKEREYILKNY